MWTRNQLKKAAKADLKGFYWLSLGVCFVFNLLSGGASVGINFPVQLTSSNLGLYNYGDYGHEFLEIMPAVLIVFLVIFVFAAAIGIAFSAFVVNPLRVGKYKFFVHKNENERGFDAMFSVFNKGNYKQIVKTMFITNLFIWLWSLLFVIPGIVKEYQYRMVPYIISENPTLPYNQAINISKRMTYGHKLSMFVLDLSFIGWIILGFFACCIGAVFINPYYEATWAQLYKVMRTNYMQSMPKPEQPASEELETETEAEVTEADEIEEAAETIETEETTPEE